ncbi:MAG TPA: nucleotidyltransferase family protein [Ramlibacter sp.]|nr:nucleotidyltransferase family protein [Ramlibacter sp.]
MTTPKQFIHDVRLNKYNRAILERWDSLELPDGWLVAGCLFQTVWNLRSGAPPEAQIKDYDIFYFDESDLSPDHEQRVQERVDQLLGDLGVPIEAKNQARVHLWYQEHFGFPYPPLRNSRDGIDRFLIPATCVGVRPNATNWDLYAPHGLPLLYEGVLASNPLTDHRPLFEEKARSYQSRWAWLRIDAGVP